MKDRFIKFGYNITTDPHFQDEKYGIDKNLQRKIEQLGLKSMDEKNTRIIKELTEMIVKYPTVPILKNYLSVAYNVRGNYEKATEINRWTIAEHPDYLFARLNEANDYMNREELDKVPEILEELLDIKAMYPDRDLFHLGELTNFMKTVIRYFALTGQYDLAENRLDILRKIAPGHPDLEEAKNLYFYALTKNATDRFEEENQLRITPKQLKFAKETGFNIPPAFIHPVVSLLYDFSNDLPEEIINKILDLPRETLIKDLEKLIDDAVSRYGFFLIDEESPADFLIHAFVFLAELNSEKSIHKVLDILEYDDDFLEFWLGDHITETLWNCLYKIGQNQTEVLNEFLLKPGIDTFAKSAIADTLCQIALHQPLRKPEIEKIFADIFNRFLAATNADNLIDSSFLSMAIGNSIDAGFHKLLPAIKRLYDKEIVDIGMNGGYNDVEKLFNEPDTFDHKRELLDIYNLYQDFNTKFGSFDEEDDDNDFNFSGLKDEITPAVSLKIGRNDPCPCGSGLKYKKCCGK